MELLLHLSISDRIEQQKERANAKIDQLKLAISEAQQLPEAKKEQLVRATDHLKVQLALGRAEARDAFEAQQKKILEAARAVEANIDSIDRNVDKKIDEAVEQWIKEEIALELALELAAVELQQERAEARAERDAQIQAVRERIQKFRSDLESKRDEVTERGATFAAEMNDAFEHVKTAFRNHSAERTP